MSSSPTARAKPAAPNRSTRITLGRTEVDARKLRRADGLHIVVLVDASALLALLYAEPGADLVLEQLEEARIVSVNLHETLAVLIRDGVPAQVARDLLDELNLDV